ncbi:hypothetical protein Hdeb2414_s0025g00661241 [Helianthus debilis subsp. tardiflorus]
MVSFRFSLVCSRFVSVYIPPTDSTSFIRIIYKQMVRCGHEIYNNNSMSHVWLVCVRLGILNDEDEL